MPVAIITTLASDGTWSNVNMPVTFDPSQMRSPIFRLNGRRGQRAGGYQGDVKIQAFAGKRRSKRSSRLGESACSDQRAARLVPTTASAAPSRADRSRRTDPGVKSGSLQPSGANPKDHQPLGDLVSEGNDGVQSRVGQNVSSG